MSHLTEDELVLHYYGEMDAAAESRAAAHVSDCAECHGSYARLQRLMALVDSVPAADAPEGFERIAWARLEAALPDRRPGLFSWLVYSPARLAFAAVVVALVAGAFYAGRQMAGRPAATVASGGASGGSNVRERILLVDLGDHLDRSQMMLVELVSAGDGATVDMSSERSRAEQLLAANRLYRETAMKSGDAATAALLDELERVLVDVAASPSTLTQNDFDEVRRRIESKGLLFKVRVVSSDVRERQRAALKQRLVS